MRLGEILKDEGLVTAAGVEQALEHQVVHGGRLGTNLVELGLLSEKDLARILGHQHRVSFASGEMRPDAKALALLPPEFADEKDVLPMRVDSTRLSLAVIDPRDLQLQDAVAFRTGKRVVPVVIPEFRMHQLLRRHCNAFRTLRAIDVTAVRPRKAEKAAEAMTDLIGEDEFQSLYAQALAGGSGSGGNVIALAEGEVDVSQPILLTPIPGRSTPVPRPALTPAPTPAPTRPLPRVELPAAGAPPPMKPLSFAEAQAELSRGADREHIAQAVLRYAVSKWKRALLLSVNGPLVTGWHGMGVGVRERDVQRMGVALNAPSTFKLVCETRAHYVGPVRNDAATQAFYKLLGGELPTTKVLLPLLVHGKVVHLLYVDDGPGQLTPPDVGELLILAQSVARSYDVLVERRKRA